MLCILITAFIWRTVEYENTQQKNASEITQCIEEKAACKDQKP